MGKDIKIDDLTNLIALKMGGGYSPETVRKCLTATYKVILEELQLNNRINFYKFGYFETHQTGGYDMKTGNLMAGQGTIIQYVKPRIRIRFKPSSVLNEAINNDYKYPSKKRKNKTKAHEVERQYYEKKPKPSMGECMADLLGDLYET